MPSELFERLRRTSKLPTPPGVVLQLLDLTRQDDVSAKEIADVIMQDPALAAKILRFANSPMAGVPREVTSLQRAISLVGVKSVKMMALSFAVLPAKGTEACPGFDQKQFGLQSIACGVSAKILADATNPRLAQEAFMAGLLSQIGRSVMAASVPTEYGTVLSQAQYIPRDLRQLEDKEFGATYPTIGAELLRSWNLPNKLCDSIAEFHNVENNTNPNDQVELAKLLYVAEIAASVICPEVKSGTPDPCDFVSAAERWLGLNEKRCTELIHLITTEIENTRHTLDMPRANMRTAEELENEIREQIAELSIAMHLENQNMARQQEDLLRRATTDGLTGIANRAAFDARLTMELERAARSGAPLTLLLMDVDKFKAFNDTYGHMAGDRVLQSVAKALDANIRKVDFVARYGGEEFAVIAPETSLEGIRNVAERLRAAVEETVLVWEGQTLKVTMSIGTAVFTDILDANCIPRVIKCADERLYAAKQNGRNRVEYAVDGKPVEQSPRPAGV